MKINDILHKLTETASRVRLAPEERASIRAVLANEISQPSVKSESLTQYIFNIQYSRIAIGAAASAFLFVGGSISFAAEKALPGDALYSVKTNFNEAVVSWMAISDAGKAKVNTQFAEKRLNEATKLASQKRLNSQKKKIISDQLKTHVAKVEDNIGSIVAKQDFATAVDVSTELETTLKAHTDVLTAISIDTATTATLAISTDDDDEEISEEDLAKNAESAESADQTAQFAEEISNASVVASALRVEAESAVARNNSFVSPNKIASEKRNDALQSIGLAEKLVATTSAAFDEQFLVMATSSLSKSKEAFGKGELSFSLAQYDEAFVHFNTAYRLSLELTQKIEALNLLPVGSVIPLPSQSKEDDKKNKNNDDDNDDNNKDEGDKDVNNQTSEATSSATSSLFILLNPGVSTSTQQNAPEPSSSVIRTESSVQFNSLEVIRKIR